MKSAVIVLLVLAVCVVGLLVAGVLEESGQTDAGTGFDTAADDASTATADTDADASTPTATGVDEPATASGDQPLVPRVLPPDAALEDVRDALAAKDAKAVRAAYERITRMTRKSASFGTALKRLTTLESDPAVVHIVRRASTTPWSDLSDADKITLLGRAR